MVAAAGVGMEAAAEGGVELAGGGAGAGAIGVTRGAEGDVAAILGVNGEMEWESGECLCVWIGVVSEIWLWGVRAAGRTEE